MASPARPNAKRIAAALPPIELLTEDLLAEILLRLPTLADIGRATASCAAFRRVAAGRAFLRRLRSVHPAPLLVLLRLVSIQPAEPPHSSAPYARAFAGAADLSFSFLPSLGPWLPVDARDGRVLLIKRVVLRRHALAVCDPLSRRYTLLPQIPGDRFSKIRSGIKPFLVPANDEEAETSFRVVCAASDAFQQMIAFIFSSATGQWSSLAIGADAQPVRKMTGPRGYAYSCLYWKVDGTDSLIVFDTRSMEFSLVHIPFSQHQQQQDLIIVEAGGGRLGTFTLDNSIISAVSQLVYAIREIDEDGSSRWRIERRVRLPSQNLFSFEDATDRYLLLRGTPWNLGLGSNMDDVETGYFSFELESMQIEKLYTIRFRDDIPNVKLFAGFPPSLCLPGI
ncbi:hypothetical protein QOZ80_7BG0603740 [Eleusine coracana subsp. coracana]|nr:hypothetical protein QOZ80_7BG0603740 [Eleusine coracana subsp. coracana]